MKLFTKNVESCKHCPNYVGGGVSVCHNDKKNPREICTYLDTMDWLKDKEHIKDPLSIPDWCPLPDLILTTNTVNPYTHGNINFTNKKCEKCKIGYYKETSLMNLHCENCGHEIDN